MIDSQSEDRDRRIPSTKPYADSGQKSPPVRGDSRQESPYDKDKLNIPKIELPKGGGALKSIDEKFQVNPANGTVSFTVPLPLSQTRSDFAPLVSLAYNSGSGNGVFGLGWSLNFSSIQRRTDKRLPEYVDAEESDIFLLSGSEDMVPALIQDAHGNWVTDEFQTATGEEVKRYRPRIEGAFARIERITPPGQNTFYWKVTSKANVATIYGRSASARIEDGSTPPRVFKWLPEISYDDKGNCLEYLYVTEDFQNVANTLHERNRLNDLAPCFNTYLKRVRYGNKNPYYADPSHPYNPQAPINPAYFYELVFDYGDHDANAPVPDVQKPWPCRLDPFSEYKAGFEIRTYRLCQRVLSFHYFKELNDGKTPAPCLVRSLDLDYRYFQNPAATSSELRNLEVDYPVAIRRTGWVKTGTSSYNKKSFPAVEFTYQELDWNRTVQAVDAENLENDPVGLSGSYQFVDLWSEGISGILTEQGGSWFYKYNLGAGQFAPAQVVAPKPSLTGLAQGTLQLQDLEADGRKFIVVTAPPLRGAFELSDDGEWQPFTFFESVPNVALNDPDTKFIDLDGDGRSDIAVSEENVFTWYPSTGINGFAGPRQAFKPFDEEQGPALVFSDPTGSIFLANMSGSGLTDIVRIRNGEVCYWPNLGYGRFGAKVSMDFSPVFDTPDMFNPAYIHLGDISGTGASDLLYLGQNKFRAWLNQSGNAWSEEQEIDPFPTTELPNQLSVTNFLGNGTACLVWSSPLPRYSATPMQYVDLMGGKKPYLLSGYKNQSGKEVTLEYKSSTYFYLADKQTGTPWITKLPFPVHCVAKVSSRDTVTRAYLTTEYTYHHGYYDHPEREYRGFGRVDQVDTETFDEFVKSGASNVVNQPLHQAPVLTRTWFHTGAFFGEDDILARFRSEYFQNADFAEYHLPSPQFQSSSAQEMREAQRACKGMTIRQEIYGLDNIAGISSVPYSATERNCLIQRLQPLGGNRYAIFLVTESESISYSYERNNKDPRIVHTLNTAIDELGNVLEAASVAYPRQPGVAGLPAPVQAEQQKLRITYAVSSYTNDVIADAAYRLRLPCENLSFELTGSVPAASYFTLPEIQGAFATATLIKYEDVPGGSPQKRSLKHSRTLFLKNDLSGPLPLQQMQSLGLKYETYRLTFTSTLLPAIYGTQVVPAFLNEGAYIHSDDFKLQGFFPASDANDEWWVHGGHAEYPTPAASFFYMPNGYVDPFGKAASVSYYDDYQLLVQVVTDPVGNTSSVEAFDFRGPSPQLIKDANANLSEVRVDALGFVVGTALQGKGGEADDFTGFVADLSPAEIAAFFADPVSNGPNLLQHATSRFVYDFTVVPFRVASIVRETHFQIAAASGTLSKLQYRFEYSDGFGNVAMVKAQAEPGLALQLDGSNNVVQVDTSPNLRWIGTGRTVLNNKGKPVKQYEPYFSVTYNYEDDPQLVEIGVSPLLYYDPPGRNVRTEYPNGTFSKIDIQGWMTQTFDQNDTVVDSAWFTARTTGSLSSNPQENQAAQKTAVHYNTPAVTHSDGLARPFYAVAHNKFIDHSTLTLKELFYETYTVLDIEGNPRQLIDPRGNAVVSYDYDMLGNQSHSHSMDASERWVFNDCTGHVLYSFDSKKQVFHTFYDDARRPVQTTVAKGAALPIVFERITYGEGQPGDLAQNLRGRTFEQRDQAGILTNKAFDFKGNLLASTRVLTVDYQNDVDWNLPPALQAEIFSTQTEYDALNRPVRVAAPSSNGATANILLPSYNEAGLLQAMTAHIRGAGATTPFVTNIDYNEKGQRTRIDYANGTSTIYKYDSDTFRLIGLVTARNTDPEPFWEDKSKIDLPAFAGDVLQYLTFTFDPVGNITYIKDDAQQTIYFRNTKVEPSADYTYDAVYWLVQSLGREHIDLHATPGPFDDARMGDSQPGDANQLQTYTLQYDYDFAGNMLQMNNVGNWSMAFTYQATNNQLMHAVPSGAVGTPFAYPYDVHGNTTAMPHLTTMDWDFKDQLRHTAVSASGSTSQESWYVYDAGGQRVRKVVTKANVTEERLYFGNVEIYRRTRNGTLELERETLHVTDDKRRIAMVDTPTTLPAGSKETQLVRYQYSNHLGTACLELDDAAQIISYEEYYPFGSTSYQGTDQTREIPAKRYRYTGKERDEESGFYYHGARYYAPWLARWTAADHAGIKDGLNVYVYVHNNPVILNDPRGTQSRLQDDSCTDHRTLHGVSAQGAPPPPTDPASPPQPAQQQQQQQPTPPVAPPPAAQQDQGAEPDEGPPPTNVNTSATASSATARPGRESEVTGTVTLGSGPTGFSASAGATAAVRFSLRPLSGGRAPLAYAWDVGITMGGTHGITDSSRSGQLTLTARYGQGTDSDGPRVSLGAAFAASVGPSVDATGAESFLGSASATGILEIALSKRLTLDLNIVGSGMIGGSTTFSGVNLRYSGTLGGQAQLGISLGHRFTLGPEALVYGTIGSGAPLTPGGPTSSVDSLRYGGGIGLSRRLGPLDVPSSVIGFQLDAFHESTDVSSGGTSRNFTGNGVILNFGGTFDTTDLLYGSHDY